MFYTKSGEVFFISIVFKHVDKALTLFS